MNDINTGTIKNLKYLCKTYDGITKLIVSTKQRLGALNPEANPKHDDVLNGIVKGKREAQGLEQIKGRVARQIEKELKAWPIYTKWLQNVPGPGAYISGNLVLAFYYCFVPICAKCGKDLEKQDECFACPGCGENAKGKGLLRYRIKNRHFPNVSSWWKFCGRHVVDGKMPKRKKGEAADWSTFLRTVSYHFGEAINRHAADEPYKAFMLERKQKHVKKHPDWTDGHVHNAAKNETAKLFLSHFWHVATELEGRDPMPGPYARDILNHSGIIKPFYWGPNRG